MRRANWILMGLVLGGIILGLVGLAGAQQKIVIYAAQDEKTTNEMTRMFTEETKIGTEVIRVAAAGTLATRIRAEKAAPRADVFMGGSVEFHGIRDVASLIALFRPPLRFVGDPAVSSVSRDIPPDDAAGCPPRDRVRCRRSPRPRPGTLSRPIEVVPSGRRAASQDPPGRVRAAESGSGVRTPLDRSAGRTLILAG